MPNLLVNYRNPETSIKGEAGYWIRIVSADEEDGELLTMEQAAELTDALYDLNPCIEEAEEDITAEGETAEDQLVADPPSQDHLFQSAEDVFGNDLEACRSDLAGDYTVQAKVIKSHLKEPYILELSSGEVVETQNIYARKRMSFSVDKASYKDLGWPVTGTLKISWRGTVLGDSGPVVPPPFEIDGTVISWGISASGVIEVDFTTQYELITIDVPGTPTEEGSLIGTSEDITILAMYHYIPYDFKLSAPEPDHSLSKGALLQLCGYMENGELGSVNDPDNPDGYPPDPVNYGCQKYLSAYASSTYYKDTCCEDGVGEGCLEYTAQHPGGVPISDEDRARYTKETPLGPSSTPDPITEFIPVGTGTAEGCGTITTRLKIRPENCCDEAEPITLDSVNTPDILPRSNYITIYVEGGLRQKTFSTSSSDTYLEGGGRRSMLLNSSSINVYANSEFCGSTKITVSDGCSTLSFHVRSDEGKWEKMENYEGCLATGAGELVSGTPGQPQIMEKISNRYKVLDYLRVTNSYQGPVGFWYLGAAAPVPGLTPNLCPNLDGPAGICTNYTVEAWAFMCTCFIRAGLPVDPHEPEDIWGYSLPDYSKPCLDPIFPSNTNYIHVCNEEMWAVTGGAMGISCALPGGGTGSGSFSSHYAAWYFSEKRENFKWVC